MENNELLQAIGQMMDSKLESVKADMAQIMDSKLESVNVDIDGKLEIVRSDISGIKADVARLDHQIMPMLQTIKEGLDGLQERNRQLDQLEAKTEDHDHRIFALEQNARKAQ